MEIVTKHSLSFMKIEDDNVQYGESFVNFTVLAYVNVLGSTITMPTHYL